MKIQDEKLDIEGKLEMFDGKELALREEVIKLKDDLNGKDLALGHLTNTLTKSANEN